MIAQTQFSNATVMDDVLSRALWRSRRGMLELDLLLVPFATAGLRSAPADLQTRYLEFLELDDWQILEWLQGYSPPSEEFAGVVQLIREATATPDA